MPDIATRFVHANNLDFEVDQCGDGDRLALCLHGFPECAYSWRHQLPLLARLGYTAWAPNLRGYGRSAMPRRVDDYALPHLIADVAGLIDAAGKRATLLIGHDWGAAIAWAFALQAVRPLERLVIMNVPHPVCMFTRMMHWPQIMRSWYVFFFQLPVLPEAMLTAFGAKAIGDAFRDLAIDKSQFPDEVLAVFRRNALRPGGMTAMLNYYRALFRHWPSARHLERLHRLVLETPTLMIWGERDTALGKELTYGTDQFVRNLTLRYLPNASHWVQQDAPAEVNAILERWLTGAQEPTS